MHRFGIVYLLINTVLQWLTIVKLIKLFINKIISIKETNSNSLGLVSRDQPPFLSTLRIEPFGWTPSNSPNIFYLKLNYLFKLITSDETCTHNP